MSLLTVTQYADILHAITLHDKLFDQGGGWAPDLLALYAGAHYALAHNDDKDGSALRHLTGAQVIEMCAETVILERGNHA